MNELHITEQLRQLKLWGIWVQLYPLKVPQLLKMCAIAHKFYPPQKAKFAPLPNSNQKSKPSRGRTFTQSEPHEKRNPRGRFSARFNVLAGHGTLPISISSTGTEGSIKCCQLATNEEPKAAE